MPLLTSRVASRISLWKEGSRCLTLEDAVARTTSCTATPSRLAPPQCFLHGAPGRRREHAALATARRSERAASDAALSRAKADAEAAAAANAELEAGLRVLEAAGDTGGEGDAALRRKYADAVRRMAVVQVRMEAVEGAGLAGGQREAGAAALTAPGSDGCPYCRTNAPGALCVACSDAHACASELACRSAGNACEDASMSRLFACALSTPPAPRS